MTGEGRTERLADDQRLWDRRMSHGRGAYEDGRAVAAGVVMIAGPIKHWWGENWMTPEHVDYEAWRDRVSDALVEAGYLVYHPHRAFRGTWDERAQAINDTVVLASDAVVVISPDGVPSKGTDDEVRHALEHGRRVVYCPCKGDGRADERVGWLLKTLEEVVRGA